MKMRKIPATMPPATSMKTPVGQDAAPQLRALHAHPGPRGARRGRQGPTCHVLEGAVLAHADAEAGAEEQLARGDQVALLRGLELQHGRVPDEGVQLAVGGAESGLWGWATSAPHWTPASHRAGLSLVPHGLNGFRRTLVVVFLHVPVHGAQLHLPPEVDVHRALLHRGVDELVRRVSQLQGQRAALVLASRRACQQPSPTSLPVPPPGQASPGGH